MLLVALALAQAAPFDINADYGALAREHCRIEWRNDFQMQAYCLGQQRKGMAEFAAVYKEFGPALDAALRACTEDWTTARIPNWELIGYCAKQQGNAYRSLNGPTARE